jgi:N-acetylneuraminate lyase
MVFFAEKDQDQRLYAIVKDAVPMGFRLTGLVAATFTPMHENGSLNLALVGPIVDHLLAKEVSAIYVCGSTGEGPSLSTEEREATAAAYVTAMAGRVPVLVQVGHASLTEARRLAAHAQRIGAQAISAPPPYYFKPDSLDNLVDCLAEIATAAPDLPFYYYHIPRLTGIELNMLDLLRVALKKVPSLAGIKYSDTKFDEYAWCVEFDGGRFDVPFGCDNVLLSGLVAGARAAVGTTYNYMAPLDYRMIDAFTRGDLQEARRCQTYALKLIHIMLRYGGNAGLKAAMSLVGLDCGPLRLPQHGLRPDEIQQMRRELEMAGFFDLEREMPMKNQEGAKL